MLLDSVHIPVSMSVQRKNRLLPTSDTILEDTDKGTGQEHAGFRGPKSERTGKRCVTVAAVNLLNKQLTGQTVRQLFCWSRCWQDYLGNLTPPRGKKMKCRLSPGHISFCFSVLIKRAAIPLGNVQPWLSAARTCPRWLQFNGSGPLAAGNYAAECVRLHRSL